MIAPHSAIDRENFSQWAQESVRFGDIDVNAHVNNAAYLDLVQTPRVIFLRGLLKQAQDAGSWLIGRVTVDYLSSVEFPALLDIGTGIERIGTSSVVVVQGVYEKARCAAIVKSTMVHRSPGGGSAMPIDGKLRELLSSHLIPGTENDDRV